MRSNSLFKPKIWHILISDKPIEECNNDFPVSPILRRILINRGICDISQLNRFLNSNIDDLYDPWLLDGMAQAVARTRDALDRNERIMVHGDYDVDGITGTALLVRVLRILGADVTWRLPHRQRGGYDIQKSGVDAAKERGVGLIITVDCGTSAAEAIDYAIGLGIDVIVTDHHEIGTDIAKPNVLINPKIADSAYPFKSLAGVGVAFKFAEALVQECGYDVPTFRRKFCDLVAVGTVADVVPLLDENRIFVKCGLEELPRTGKKGLNALLKVSGYSTRPVTSQSLAYTVGPRINAAGRLDDASIALNLLLTADADEAAELAQVLEGHNRERQAEQERIVREALDQVIKHSLDEKFRVLVLSSKNWHPGIIGIVSNKITERYCRPSILIALDEDGMNGTGSARSTAAFDLFSALMKCDRFLERYGGHARAAGLSISADNIPEFNVEINKIADELMDESDLLPQIEIDAEIGFEDITFDFARELQLLEPYGHCNREPIFLTKNLMVLHKARMGSDKSHLKVRLGGGSDRPVECVGFSWGEYEEAFRLGSLVDVCYNIQINQFGGTETVQIVLRDVRRSEAHIGEPLSVSRLA